MINRNDKRPIYYQLVEILRSKIENEMTPNDKMLSERGICEQYGVSRTTVRLAMAELEHMGYIYKRHGKGTFVAALNKNSQNLMDSYSFTDHMKEQGKNPSTKVLSFETLESTNYFAENLGISPGEKMIKITRLRLADEEFSAGLLSDREAQLLEVPVDSACLKLLRTTYNNDNRVIEFTLSVARSDKFVYKVRHLR